MAKKKKKLSAWNIHVQDTAKDNPNLDFSKVVAKASKTYKAGNPIKRTNKKVKSKKKKVRRMAKKKRRSKRKFTISLAIVVPLLWKVSSAVMHASRGDWDSAKMDLLWHFAAIDSNFKFNAEALKTWIPLIAGIFVHKGAQKLGVNRMIAQSGIPLIRI